MIELAITASNSITAVGNDGRITSAAVRAGLSRRSRWQGYLDVNGHPITVARMDGVDDGAREPVARIGGIASNCLTNLLGEYFQDSESRQTPICLLLGVSSRMRPGPRYEDCCDELLRHIGKWTCQRQAQIISMGNASLPHAIAEAGKHIESTPGAICVIGGVDSLLRASTLDWFEQGGRLKSDSHGRHHGLVAGEAVSFLVVEGRERADSSKRPVLASIVGCGLAEEPKPRASGLPSRYSGLTEACRAAIENVEQGDLAAVFGDLNGESTRAREWCAAAMRCLDGGPEKRKLLTPARCFGDVGAASGAVMANVVTQGFHRGWLSSSVLIFCSDDHGPCGTVILKQGDHQAEDRFDR